MLIPKTISFLKRYLLKHPLYVLVYSIGYFLPGFDFSIHFYTDEEIKEFLHKGKSLIRLGDGDMVSVPLDLQHSAGRPDKIIKDWYKTIVTEYRSDSPYILSVPRFLNQTNKEIKSIGDGKFTLWMPVKTMFLLNFNKHASYMDAHNFYYDNYFETVVAPVFKDKKVVLVANKVMIDAQKQNKNLPWKDIAYVEAPPHNAIDAYDEIVANIETEIQKHDKKDVVLFIAIGPVAKHLVYEYAKRGYQSIDIGRIASTMFTGESIQHLSI